MDTSSQPWQRRLYLPVYSVSEAARYAQTAASTVSRWHHGTGSLVPALPGKEKGEPLSYLQLVEVAFVASFRGAGVSLQRIRKSREFLREKFGSEFPFATYQFLTEGKHILVRYLDDAEADTLVKADENGQIAWKPIMGNRFAQFEYAGGLTIQWRPFDLDSPVIIDPRVAFGSPAVRGVPTWALKGRHLSGESIEEIAEDFNLTPHEVKKALEFEGLLSAA